MTNRCDAELCPSWTGDGCICQVFGLERKPLEEDDEASYGDDATVIRDHRGRGIRCTTPPHADPSLVTPAQVDAAVDVVNAALANHTLVVECRLRSNATFGLLHVPTLTTTYSLRPPTPEEQRDGIRSVTVLDDHEAGIL